MRIGDYIPVMAEKCTSFVMKNPGKVALVAALAASCFSLWSLGSALKRAQDLDVDEFGNKVRPEESLPVANRPPRPRPPQVRNQIKPTLQTIFEDTEEENIPASPKKCRRPPNLQIKIPEISENQSPPKLDADLTFEEALDALERKAQMKQWGSKFVGDF